MSDYFEVSEMNELFLKEGDSQQDFGFDTGFEPEDLLPESILSETMLAEFEVITGAPQILAAYMHDQLAYI